LKSAGYEYVVLDEGWQESNRTADGHLQMNSSSFPGGINSIVDYIHHHQLKVGLYGDSGIMTCGFNPGSYGYEMRDALTLAEWQIDYWKYDNCGGFAAMTQSPEDRFGCEFSKCIPLVSS
jgi:alpha-galactosidase